MNPLSDAKLVDIDVIGLITLRAKLSSAVYCNRPVCGCVCLFVCGGTKVYRVVDNRLDDTQLQNDLDVPVSLKTDRTTAQQTAQSAGRTLLDHADDRTATLQTHCVACCMS